MNRACWLLSGLLVFACVAEAGQDDKPKNPFGIANEPRPDDAAAKEFARNAKLAGDANDANAPQWVNVATEGKADKLDGLWSGRWTMAGTDGRWQPQTEATKVATVGNRVYILFKTGNVTYLLVTVREGKNRLVGRYVCVEQREDKGLYTGLIVNGERIDGMWNGIPGGEGRWDFRRKLK